MPEKSAELLAKMGVVEAYQSPALLPEARPGARRVYLTDRRRDPRHPAHQVRRLREGGAPRRRDRVRRAAPERRH